MTAVDRAALIDAAVAHSRVAAGMTTSSPDICRCGARVMPDSGDDEISIRRDRAFAAHQLDAVLPLIAAAIETMPIPFTKDAEKMEWGHGVRLVAVERVRSFMRDGADGA